MTTNQQRITRITACAFFIVQFMLSGFTQEQQAHTVFGEVLVRLKMDADFSHVEKAVSNELGLLPEFRFHSQISDYMNIWLCTFDESAISKSVLIHTLKKTTDVMEAQANHIIEERIVPDDPFFGQQWHHQQSEDHDIDTDLAWDITTGGTTVSGDEIVVCIVELGGAKWNTADIADNHWVNENEIPDNSIDDDNNGYVDDYHGWNTSSASDAISEGDHGTRVSSMIGSSGNNASGVTGVNWNVKMMQVEIGGSTEANAIAGYTYPLKMRKLYNQTNGEQGAFVVATNSSWGTNNGQPDEAPLWCAMYDSLGVHGVLSCGATTNSNVDIDQFGDLPTACPSDFLVSVARTNSQDVRAGGGFGITTIDLAAPGDNVYLANNTAYGTTTGTSFSSPCVAGAIALLYAAPCNSFMQFVNQDPSDAALLLKDFILDGVDQTTQLIDETVSGGRLNVNNSLGLLMGSCDNSSCIPPFSIDAEQMQGTLEYTITWDILAGIESYALQFHAVGNPEWTTVSDITNGEISLGSLLACTTYEVQVMSNCSEGNSNWSSIFTFTTDGCCIHPDQFELINTTDSSASISWNTVLAAQGYDIAITANDGSEWIYEDVSQQTLEIIDLYACESYVVSIQSVCDNAPATAQSFSFHTGGCDACDDLQYCTVSANASAEHIQQVTIGDIDHQSQSDGGYVLVTDMTTNLVAGMEYTITCTPGYPGQAYNENFKAWIDYNSNGEFDEPLELVFDAPAATTTFTEGTFTVPDNITNGIVRLRVGMAYTPPNSNQEPSACGSWNYGETEDYCVMLLTEVGVHSSISTPLLVYPNPANSELNVVLPSTLSSKVTTVDVYNMSGALMRSFTNRGIAVINMPIVDFPAGLYHIVISGEEYYASKQFVRQ